MSASLPRDPERIAIFRALNLGDTLCAIPAIRALRAAFPGTDITLIGLPGMADLARRFSKYFTSFSSFPGAPGLPEQSFDLDTFSRFLRRERAASYDLVVQMHGKGSITNSVVCMFAARRYAGYYEPGAFCPDASTFMPYPEGIPEVRRHLRLMEFLGFQSRGEALEFPVMEHEWQQQEALVTRHGIDPGNYVCVHPGARDARRWWAPGKFARVADLLVERGSTVVFTGTAGERRAVDRVRAQMNHPSINLAGETDLGVLGALIGRARLLVSNDTGVSHLAAAMGTASVVIFLSSDPARWAPLDRQRHRIVLPEKSGDIEGVMFHVDRALQQPVRDAALQVTS